MKWMMRCAAMAVLAVCLNHSASGMDFAERSSRLCLSKHRRHRSAAYRYGSLCSVSSRNGAAGAHYYSGRYRSLSG